MKIRNILSLLLVFVLASCNVDDVLPLKLKGKAKKTKTVTVAKPIILTKKEVRDSVAVIEPKGTIDEAGKIYFYDDYIFVNEKGKGIHVIDNVNPAAPTPISFISLLGSEDMSVKDNYLFADSFTDLVVFDISNIKAIKRVNIIEEVFETYWLAVEPFVDFVEFVDVDALEDEVFLGWEVVEEEREIEVDVDENGEEIIVEDSDGLMQSSDSFEFATADSKSGVGGSLARFKIVKDFLYTVGPSTMSVFDISNLENPIVQDTVYLNWGIETIFYADNYLYLGGSNGMYIYGMNNPAAPEYISEFVHWEGCDPVVVDGDYAYVTLRGGNACGVEDSVLEVIDVSDKTNPTLIESYELENPYGLGFKKELLFVCDGTAGLKIFDKSKPENLELLSTHEDIQARDVIPLEKSIIMIGAGVLYQYEYDEENISLLSTLEL